MAMGMPGNFSQLLLPVLLSVPKGISSSRMKMLKAVRSILFSEMVSASIEDTMANIRTPKAIASS